ncbi:hypothetical protein GGS23DRAFT_79744 [Durotheca rogersii]|uniref:uncharacterized protein n=1 Tax=Durotheca rogersii TaxID=419775 RepID=UPI00221E9103|nr:uncharacterized protein GGS23DRAFT_79744 [Durotheca rogersii]KAI5862517.1 hypothetical protein GGS23DRAFT_79744 [Durotheca rogersii]
MSPNVRAQGPPATLVKVSRRRGSDVSSSIDLSDEGGYSAVEDISDSEDDDEEDVNAAEEEHILTGELLGIHSTRSPRPHPGKDEQDDSEEGDDEDDDDYEGDNDEDADETGSWNGIASEADIESQVVDQGYASTERRVRFDIPDSSDDDTETDEDVGQGFFPDLFVDKSALDPSFRREIEHDPDPYDSSTSEAFWDHYGASGELENDPDEPGSDFEALMHVIEDEDSTPIATPMTSHELSTGLSTPTGLFGNDDESLDGYQTDGDTTDEEDPPENPLRRKTRRELVDDSSDSDVVPLIRPRRGQPRVGRFNLDKSSKKPIAILNPRTGKMMIFTPQCVKGRGFDLSPEQFNFQYFDQSQSSPILSNPGNIMMSGMISSSTYGDFMNTHAIGPAEAWYAQASDGGNAIGSSDSDDHVVDEAEKSLRLEDFITIDDDDDDDDDDDLSEDEKDLEQGTADDGIFCTPARPGTSSSDVASLLDHFQHNANIVGAFRRDQVNHQLISRSKATRESLAFSGPYFEGTLRGIKDGRIATANVPISPLRKQKKMPDIASSPLSAMSQKRKASSEHHIDHKRQRSIPDVDLLRI